MERRLRAVTIGSWIIGLAGVVDTVRFYVTGDTTGWLSSFNIHWDWGFTLYVSWFLPALLVAYGINTKIEGFRLLGLFMPIVYVVSSMVSLMVVPVALAIGENLGASTTLLLSILLCGFGVWQFLVLKGADVRSAFKPAGNADELPDWMKSGGAASKPPPPSENE